MSSGRVKGVFSFQSSGIGPGFDQTADERGWMRIGEREQRDTFTDTDLAVRQRPPEGCPTLPMPRAAPAEAERIDIPRDWSIRTGHALSCLRLPQGSRARTRYGGRATGGAA